MNVHSNRVAVQVTAVGSYSSWEMCQNIGDRLIPEALHSTKRAIF